MGGLSAAAVMLAGCTGPNQLGMLQSPAPIATNFPAEFQRTLGGARHWQLVAADAGERLIDGLTRRVALPGGRVTFRVGVPDRASAFDQAFAAFLENAVIDASFRQLENQPQVTINDRGGAEGEIRIRSLLVENGARRVPPPPGARAGTLTATGLVGWLVYRAVDAESWAIGVPAVAGGLVLSELFQGLRRDTPRTEVVILADVYLGGQKIYGFDAVYYLPRNNAALYREPVNGRLQLVAD